MHQSRHRLRNRKPKRRWCMTGGLMVQVPTAAVVVDIPVGDITELQVCRTVGSPVIRRCHAHV